MIFGNSSQKKICSLLEEKVQRCLEYAKTHNLVEYKPGSYPIEGEDIFVNIVEYETKTPEERFWEAHKKYIDIHYLLRGQEQINLNFIEKMEQKEFVEKDDFLPLEGQSAASVILNETDFLVCYPEDGHMTAIKVDKPMTIKKAIFKAAL